MTKETLLAALEAEKIKAGTDGVSVPEERDATFMVAGHGETIQVGRVVRIETRDSAVCFETAKGERYWFTYDLVLGLRLRSHRVPKELPTGFGK
jgi:hypothetical protein